MKEPGCKAVVPKTVTAAETRGPGTDGGSPSESSRPRTGGCSRSTSLGKPWEGSGSPVVTQEGNLVKKVRFYYYFLWKCMYF